jgi:hypothetical protein
MHDDRNLMQIFTYTFFKLFSYFIFYVRALKKWGLYTRRHLVSYYIFLCKVTVLTCLMMAKVQAETCSTHVKDHFWIKINLCCVGMNKCRLWECRVASYSDQMEKLGAGKVWVQISFQILRWKRWLEGNRHGINVLFIEHILHNIKWWLKLNMSIKSINNSNNNTFREQHQYCIRSKYN